MASPLPQFEDLHEEIDFWKNHDVVDFVDFSDLNSFLRGSNKSTVIALRIEPVVREQAKRVASRQGKKYQTLLREWIYEGLERSIRSQHGENQEKTRIEVLTELVSEMSKDLEALKGEIADE